MRTRTTPTVAVALAVGALLGWLAASGGVTQRLHAQDRAPENARPSETPLHWDEVAKLPSPGWRARHRTGPVGAGRLSFL
jgi:hypothetical protein